MSDDTLIEHFERSLHELCGHERIQAIPKLEIAVIQDAGHMMHRDQPQALAALIERFMQ